MAKKRSDPLYVTWRRRLPNSRLEEVDIFGFIASRMGVLAHEWNTKGLGSILFKKGTLKIIPPKETGTGNDYEAQFYELELKTLKEGTNRVEDYVAGLNRLFEILNDKTELIKLEREAFGYMIDLLRDHLGRLNALTMVSSYRSKYNRPKVIRYGKTIVI